MANAVITKKDALDRIAGCNRQLHDFGVNAIGIFGSFSRDQANEQSDVDVLVQFDTTKKTFDNFIETLVVKLLRSLCTIIRHQRFMKTLLLSLL